MKRYVNIYEDKDGRHISDIDWDNRGDAETFPIVDRELVVETVRLLSKEEEDAVNELLKQANEAWATLDHNIEEILVHKLSAAIDAVK
jgi:hypothetical protein